MLMLRRMHLYYGFGASFQLSGEFGVSSTVSLLHLKLDNSWKITE